jgi:hypothetical protein
LVHLDNPRCKFPDQRFSTLLLLLHHDLELIRLCLPPIIYAQTRADFHFVNVREDKKQSVNKIKKEEQEELR